MVVTREAFACSVRLGHVQADKTDTSGRVQRISYRRPRHQLRRQRVRYLAILDVMRRDQYASM